jgi:isoleucyl-tRNA synthetase
MDGRKMSKSLGNVIEPQAVIKESGAEILRLWVAMSDYREELRVSKQILARVIEAYRKIRNTLRYLVSNLYDFDPAVHSLPADRLQEVDRFALARYAEMASSVIKAYDGYDYPSIFQTVNGFMTVDVSAFYADVSKDRLYTFAAASPERRSSQTAMYVMADGLARLLAPILPITADELWRHLPGAHEDSVHLAVFPEGVEALRNPALLAEWDRLLAIRDDVNRALEAARQSKVIGTSLGAAVTLGAAGETAALLRQHEADLPMLFIVSQVRLEERAGETVDVTVARADGQKCDRCWRIVPDVSTEPGTEGLCSRCIGALELDAPRAAR